jgi:DNA-binding NarL/FixJ family response regulator
MQRLVEVSESQSRLDGCVLEVLTDREREVLQLVADGGRNREIARRLRISVKTVEFHLSNIRGKLGARSRTEAVVRACQVGLLSIESSSVRRMRDGRRAYA